MARAGAVKIQLSVESASYSQSLDKAKQQLDQLAGGARQAGHSTVSSMQASSAALRELNGDFTNNIRAVERFITTIPGVGQALQVAFPVVGALALAGVIGNLATKIFDFYKKLGETPRAIQNGFNGIILSTQTATDELIKKTDETNDHINVLLGKRPENQAKIAIDDTRIAADQLAASATNAAKQIIEMMAANKVSAFASIVSSKGGTDVAAGTAGYYLKDLQDKSFQAQQAYHGGNQALGDQLTAAYKQRRSEAIANLSADAQNRQDHANQFSGDQAPSISILRGTASVLMSDSDKEAAQDNDKKANELQKRIEQQKSLAAAQREAQKRAQEEEVRSFEQGLESQKASQEMSKSAEAGYWVTMAAIATTGGKTVQYALSQANKAISSERDEAMKNREAVEKGSRAAFRAAATANAGDEDDSKRFMQSDAKAAQENLKALNDNGDGERERQQSFAMREVQAQVDAAQGTLSRYDIVTRANTLHADEYADAMARLQRALVSVNQNALGLSPNEQAAQRNSIIGQMADMSGSRAMQEIQDKASLDSTTLSGSFRTTLNEFVQQSRDTASQVKEIFTNSLQSVNGALSSSLTAYAHTSRQYWRDVREGLSGSARGIAGGILNTGMQKAEGAALGALGFGAKADGSQANPLWVKIVGAVGSIGGAASSGISSILSRFSGSKTLSTGGSDPLGLIAPGAVDTASAFGTGGGFSSLFQGFFASGGDVVSDRPAIIGEKGPEMFIPKTAGTIVPNNQLDMGDTHHHWNVDARGSNDPAAVNLAVMRGIREAAPHIIAASNSARTERNRRLPSSQRV